MLRVTELKLPLGHAEGELRAAILARLGLGEGELIDFTVARRANDARRKSAILMVYSVDVTVADETAVLALRFSAPALYAASRRTRVSSALYLFQDGRWSLFQPPLQAQ